ncbi:MAG TPA: M2 family metallopeptidase [Vicinamibacterales bacterium]|nr:M2 family metallopeptidase [Vicinamibacterales bacterium]
MARLLLTVLCASAMLAACSRGSTGSDGTATAEEARQFLTRVNDTMKQLGVALGHAGWAYATNINPETEAANAKANQAYIEATARFAKEATRFDAIGLPNERRQLDLLKLALVIVTPSDPQEAEELTKIAASMEGTYGRGKWCPGAAPTPTQSESAAAAPPPPDADPCLDVEAITRVMAESRDPLRLRDVWEGWHTIAPPMKRDFARYVELANTGARELGFADTGAMWRAKYDMPPDDFTRELDRLWEQVRPLYVSLHAYVRTKLREKYDDEIPARGPLPAHLLGNIWAQDWSNVFPLVSPPSADPGYDLTAILEQRKLTPIEMVQSGERFFTSLGFAPLPQTFYERSLFTKPPDREVVCHASAWNVDLEDDLRIKMCIDPTAEDFTTIHHELGHNFYQRAYKHLPVLFRDSANDGFHEAVGDTIGLSVTPEYLVKIGLLDKAPDSSRDIGLLLQQALSKIAFLPFGLLIDQWRWRVFSGDITPDQYNQAWWDLRLKYQGVAPPSPRGEQHFDPGAKYHVPANYPYARYFLAHILQFQFHRALAQVAGCSGPLHRCSIHQSTDAGQKLNAMLELGMSRPWPDALEALTGDRQMDATAIRDYFAPLQAWLDQQNAGKPVGW